MSLGNITLPKDGDVLGQMKATSQCTRTKYIRTERISTQTARWMSGPRSCRDPCIMETECSSQTQTVASQIGVILMGAVSAPPWKKTMSIQLPLGLHMCCTLAHFPRLSSCQLRLSFPRLNRLRATSLSWILSTRRTVMFAPRRSGLCGRCIILGHQQRRKRPHPKRTV